jgi:hypothetical protein
VVSIDQPTRIPAVVPQRGDKSRDGKRGADAAQASA